jgi:hypothetical protein
LTALKPIENRNIRGVPGYKYPLNKKCAHPDCTKETESAHHIFGRPPPEGKSWFVAIQNNDEPGLEAATTIPHVIGLCGSGTTGHHGDLEEHRAWIKYEDGEFIWYDRSENRNPFWNPVGNPNDEYLWDALGPLNPQPCDAPKTKKSKNRKGDERKNKPNVSIPVPKEDREDGAILLYEAVEQYEEILGYDPSRSMYYTIMDALNIAILHGKQDA